MSDAFILAKTVTYVSSLPVTYVTTLYKSAARHVANTTCVGKQNRPPDMSFRPQRQRSGGIHSSSKNNLRKVKSAAWEDPSTPFHFGRDDMSVGGFVLPARVIFATFRGDESSPLHCVVPFNRTGCIRNVAGG